MSIKPTILVTSAGGKTGLPTALQLRERGFPVRALVRRDDHRARRLAAAGAEIFVGNQYALADMRRAMRGVQRAYHCAPTAVNGLHFGTVFAIAAQEAGLEHVVTLSQWLAHPDHPSVITRESWMNDRVIELLPDTSLTVNNVGWFADNYFMVLESVAQLGLLPMPLGDGEVKKDAPPSSQDIATVNVEALIDPALHAGKVYRPTGPTLMSPNEIAAVFAKVLERKVVYREISEAMLTKALGAQGAPESMQTQLRFYTEEYRRGTFAVSAPSNVLADVAGRPAEDFETITRRTVASRPVALRTFGSRLRAISNFGKLLRTPSLDFEAVERRREHVLLQAPDFALDSTDWRRRHDPGDGFVADRPAPAAIMPTPTAVAR